MKKRKLTQKITEKEFANGYWYADEIKSFAKEIGIPNSSKLRKDELEKLILEFIKTGKVGKSNRKNIAKTGTKDIDLGLTNSLQIQNYTSNKITKNFIITEAYKLKPELKIKSGVWYRLNRWRDEQFTQSNKITYGDLVKEFIKLNEMESFEKVSVVRYINFLSEFLANEKGATREQAIREWKKLKTIDTEKNYSSWKKLNKKTQSKKKLLLEVN